MYDCRRDIEEQSALKIDRFETIDISVALSILKARHRLSNNCISDILHLLKVLRVPNVPNSWWKCQDLLQKKSTVNMMKRKRSICPTCKKVSNETDRCHHCEIPYRIHRFSNVAPIFYNFDIATQLDSILLNTDDLFLCRFPKQSSSPMTDIVDGDFYEKLLLQEGNDFITLTMNIDGVQPNKGSDNSIWPVLLVINEIRKKKRFSQENLILAGVWPGPSKPNRNEMAAFLQGKIHSKAIKDRSSIQKRLHYRNC